MARPLSISPRPSGNPKLPWVVHIRVADRARYDGQKRRYFAKEGEANTFSKVLRRERANHTAAFNQMPDSLKAQCHEAVAILAPYPNAKSLPDLARQEAVSLDIAAKSKPLGPLVEMMLVEKKADGRRARYLTGLRGMLNVFAKAFPDRLASSFTSKEIAEWLRETYANPNSRDSYRRNIGVLFSWAKDKGFVVFNPITETKAVNARKEEEVGILSPLQLIDLLRCASPRLRPYIVVSAFAALRPNEGQKITWDHVNTKGIYVPKAITKTVARHIPVLPTLAAWLEHFGVQRGKLFSKGERTWRRDFDAARKAAGLFENWDQDALRHSAISYWLAIEPNRAAVAKWSANSEDVQTRHYDNPRSAEEAAAWYAVLPETIPAYVAPPRNKGGRPKAFSPAPSNHEAQA